jgi:hypothetical protein
MLDRMTDRARWVFELAREEALRLNHGCIMPEHILVGLVTAEGVAKAVLARLNVDCAELRLEIEKRFPPGHKPLPAGRKIPYAESARKLLERSFQMARSLNHNYIGTEHLLLALVAEGEGTLNEILQVVGLTAEGVRQEVIKFLNEEPPGQPAPELAAVCQTEAIIPIGSRRQLFIDWRLVSSGQNVWLTVNPPVKAGPIDLDTEHGEMASIVSHGGRHYLYMRLGERGIGVAVSEDGLKWRGVDSSLFGQGRQLPLPGVDSGSVFTDPKDSEYPLKGIFDIRQAEPWGADPSKLGDIRAANGRTAARGGLYLFRSPDGFRWELVPGLPVPFLCDTQNQVLYDPRIDRYVAYFRAFPRLGGPHNYKRCVARTEVDDLLQMPWPHGVNMANKPEGLHAFAYTHDEMPIVMAADSDDPPRADLYNPAMHLYPWADSVYLAFPSMYNTWGYDGKNISFGRDQRGLRSNDGLFETHLAVSRDGINFTRYRTPYIPSGRIYDREGKEGELDCGLIYMAVGMIRHGDEIHQFYFGTRRTHMSAADGAKFGFHGQAVFRAVQRLDGFVSADTDHRGGDLVTPPLVFEGSRLVLNAACHGLGEIAVEVQEADGSPVPGFSLSDAVTIVRNGTNQEVWWKGGPDVRQLAGRPVRLRFKMRSAKLFAFQFLEDAGG